MMQDFYGVTTLHPVGLAAVFILGIAMLLLPRRFAVWPMIVMACFIAPSQRLVIMEADFTLLRLMILFGMVRVLVKHEHRDLVLRPIDYVFIAWALAGSAAYILLQGTTGAIVFKLGAMYEALGAYFIFRCLLRSWEDLRSLALGFALISLPVAMFFLVEWRTGRNLFSMFGGVPEMTLVREDRLRCRGAFAHAILAGCFWAAAMPLIAALWWRGGPARTAAIAGTLASGLIVVLCASSTPVMAVIFGLVGGLCYLIRNSMRHLRWTILLVLLVLHFLLMQGPVWSLVARVNIVSGATGWHRFHLVDQTISRVGEWWLLGTTSTEHWGRGLHDITNQYVLEAVRGGLMTLGLFVAVIALAFRSVGQMWRSAPDKATQLMAWAVGVSLFVHVTSFLGVSYFGQINILWYLTLASAAAIPLGAKRPRLLVGAALVARPATGVAEPLPENRHLVKA